MTPEIAAEAAVWIARLHGPDRSVGIERECLAWQARSAAHRLAFERCTDTWQDVAGLTLTSYARAASAAASDAEKEKPMKRRRWALAGAALAVGGVLVLQPWSTGETYATGVGEQRLVVLQDGTRITLNTATRVQVEISRTQRTVKVEGGEALFEVAKDAGRPFVVQAAGTEVLATGTAFVVRLVLGSQGVGDALDVTLVEGQVIVHAAIDSATGAVAASPVVMAAGERVRLRRPIGEAPPGVPREAMQVDRPRMDQALAWKRGEAVFDDVSLFDAAAEMNRYSTIPIMVAGAEAVVGLRVSGVFKTGDNASFARAVAALHGLVVLDRAGRLELAQK